MSKLLILFESRAWRAVGVVALLGLVAWVVNRFDPASGFAPLLGFLAWAGAVAACAIALRPCRRRATSCRRSG
ncbi:hypothetical protein DFR50_1024 [Roseiarcus fermentans]|uniref:Uncharacterized protein n=1 Tax=Roseiarcus fermentans TaxID=1473586 RepID=A0A366FS61_9HYPH|nr:hypothetical protein [Roseiarcus fermentans]RBP17513.1 hypothetical protein DFR50_1024 [Roseiarcus fermentans]